MSDNMPMEDPLRFAVSVRTEAEYMRLPPTGKADPIFALKRSFLNSLVLPCRENGWRPPVKSIVLRRKRARKGVRLIEIASLRAYILKQVQAGVSETSGRANVASASAAGAADKC